MTEIKTRDIFKGAFLLACGGHLSGSHLEQGKRMVFIIEGDGLEDHELSYRSGHALVNPLQLRQSLNLLRDLIHESTRKVNYGKGQKNQKNWKRKN